MGDQFRPQKPKQLYCHWHSPWFHSTSVRFIQLISLKSTIHWEMQFTSPRMLGSFREIWLNSACISCKAGLVIDQQATRFKMTKTFYFSFGNQISSKSVD